MIGFDAGEWGGSLWWYSGDGAQRRRLSANPVVGLFEHGDTVWALGESAQSPRRGQVLVLEKDEGEAWQPHLGPQVLRGVAAAARDGETLLVASLHAVEEIRW
ncbi:hypothetical protein [Enhygromyxa salina]|uniref:hypothetical protein n=1 Tax=Enhygromyxa salina TaxID=215803 RepID=UPI0011B25C85|nr:hypothetical protein [Enhygromyxa salina]